MRICFLISNWSEISPLKSSTLTLIHECKLRGHTVYIGYPSNLTVRNNTVYGFLKKIVEPKKVGENIQAFYKKVSFTESMIPLHGLDAIFIRKDPPIDPIKLNFLDSVKQETLVINDIDGLRKANNKLYTTTFYDPNNTFLPITHVSKNKTYIKKIIEESPDKKMILKPLDGSGGSGVIIIEKDAKSNIKSLLDYYLDSNEKNYLIVQQYVQGAENGDVRVLMLNGKAIGAYNRKPAEGEIRANISVGGSAHKYELSEAQKQLCKKVGPKLIEDGLYFVGLDIIGDKLIEVNVLNPGGITNINKLNKVRLQKKVVDFIEEKIVESNHKRAELQYRINRRSEFKE